MANYKNKYFTEFLDKSQADAELFPVEEIHTTATLNANKSKHYMVLNTIDTDGKRIGSEIKIDPNTVISVA